MIFVYLLAVVAALIVYASTYRLGHYTRMLIAIIVFIIPSVSVTVWIYMVGDKAPLDAVTVFPNGEISVPSKSNLVDTDTTDRDIESKP